MTPNPQSPKKKLTIEEAGQPFLYANVASIRATGDEFFINFGMREDDPDQAVGLIKIIVSPAHAKQLAIALIKTIEHYEKNFGEIKADIEERLTPEARKRISKSEQEDQNGT